MLKLPEGVDVGEVSDGYHTFNELYDHRCTLFAILMKTRPGISWYSKVHNDGEVWSGWFITGMQLPTGSVTYHMPDSMWDSVSSTGATHLEIAPEWDGHTSADALNRLKGIL